MCIIPNLPQSKSSRPVIIPFTRFAISPPLLSLITMSFNRSAYDTIVDLWENLGDIPESNLISQLQVILQTKIPTLFTNQMYMAKHCYNMLHGIDCLNFANCSFRWMKILWGLQIIWVGCLFITLADLPTSQTQHNIYSLGDLPTLSQRNIYTNFSALEFQMAMDIPYFTRIWILFIEQMI